MALESGPQGSEQHANWKAPEKKPFNPASMEETLRDIKKESTETYKDLPPPPVAEDEVPTFLGREVEAPRVERTDFDLGDLDIDSFLSNLKASENGPATRDVLADTLPSARIERASDYDLSPPPVESQPEEKLEMRGDQIVIDGVVQEIPAVLDPAIEAIIESPEHLPLEELAHDPKEMARYLTGIDNIFANEVVSLWKLRADLLNMPHLSPEHRKVMLDHGKIDLAHRIKGMRLATKNFHSIRAGQQPSKTTPPAIAA